MTHEFKTGDWCRVDLPHSPTMLIFAIDSDDPVEVHCIWFDTATRFCEGGFRPEHLIPVSRGLAELQSRGEPGEEAPMEGR